jgi:hypothetical protein
MAWRPHDSGNVKARGCVFADRGILLGVIRLEIPMESDIIMQLSYIARLSDKHHEPRIIDKRERLWSLRRSLKGAELE